MRLSIPYRLWSWLLDDGRIRNRLRGGVKGRCYYCTTDGKTFGLWLRSPF